MSDQPTPTDPTPEDQQVEEHHAHPPEDEGGSIWGTVFFIAILVAFIGILLFRSWQVRRWVRAISFNVTTQEAVQAAEELVQRKKIVKVFKRRTVQAKENATTVLQVLGTERAGKYLVELAEDFEVPVREAATEALARGGPAFIEPLIEDGLPHADQDVRRRSIQALVNIGYPGIPSLIDALGSATPSVREGAAIALGEIGSPMAVRPLIGVMGAAEEDVRIAAREALVKTGATGVPLLVEALENTSYLIRWGAAEALGDLGDPEAVPALIERLQKGPQENRLVRIAAAYALGKLGQQEAVAPLIAALDEDDKDLREAAAVSLGLLKDERAVPALAGRLYDPDEPVQEQAAEALGRLGGEQAVQLAMGALSADDARTREYAALALGRIGDPQSVSGQTVTLFRAVDFRDLPAFLARLRSGEDAMSRYLRARLSPQTQQMLASYDGSQPPGQELQDAIIGELNQLIQQPDLFDLRRLAQMSLPAEIRQLLEQEMNAEVLVRLNRMLLQVVYRNQIVSGSASGLIALLDDPEPRVRRRAAWALGQTRSPAAVQPLERAFRDPDWRVAYAAIDALAQIGETAVEPLIETLGQTQDPLLSSYASKALARMSPPPLERLRTIMLSGEGEARLYAALTLAEVGTDEAVQALRGVARDEAQDTRLRWVAERALYRMGREL